jgi:hypothetical protein
MISDPDKILLSLPNQGGGNGKVECQGWKRIELAL